MQSAPTYSRPLPPMLNAALDGATGTTGADVGLPTAVGAEPGMIVGCQFAGDGAVLHVPSTQQYEPEAHSIIVGAVKPHWHAAPRANASLIAHAVVPVPPLAGGKPEAVGEDVG